MQGWRDRGQMQRRTWASKIMPSCNVSIDIQSCHGEDFHAASLPPRVLFANPCPRRWCQDASSTLCNSSIQVGTHPGALIPSEKNAWGVPARMDG